MAPPCCRLFPNSPCISKRGRTASAFGSPGLCLQKGRVRWVLLALSSSCLCSWLCCPVFAISSRQHTYKSYRFEVAYGWLLAAGKERSLSAEDGFAFLVEVGLCWPCRGFCSDGPSNRNLRQSNQGPQFIPNPVFSHV